MAMRFRHSPSRAAGTTHPAFLVPAAFVVAIAIGAAACGGGGSDGASNPPLSEAGARGHTIAKSNGCAGCHGADGQGGVGPTWVGLYGSEVELADDTTVVADDEYLTRAISDPGADIVKGASVKMPSNDLSDEQIADVVAYIRDLSTTP
jgi:mono/diheme cytochrome c family protein